jgi:hypothetical protein
VDRLNSTAVRVLRNLLDGQPATEAKVVFAWKIAAGPSLARATTLRWAAGGTLAVTAKSDEWRKEIRHALPLIEARMAELLGPGVVRRVTLTADVSSPSARGRRGHP